MAVSNFASVSNFARAEGKASGTGAAATATPTVNKTLRLARRTTGMTYHWYIITGVIFGFMVWYASRLGYAAYTKRRALLARQAGDSSESKRGGLTRFGSAISVCISNLLYVQVIPLSIYARSTPVEWLWCAIYTGLTLGVGFYASLYGGKFDFNNVMGMVAFAQMPLIVGLASKNSVLSAITGVSYEKFNYLHRTAGRVCVLTSALHTFGWVKTGLGKHGPGHDVFTTGVVAGVGLIVMYLTSFKLVRSVFYEFFILCHISFGLMFIVGSYYHWKPMKMWIWPCLFLWGLDRFVGILRLAVINKWWSFSNRATNPAQTARVEHMGNDVVRLTFNRPALKWSPGQHAFITIPSVATLRYEQHPFTLASTPDDSGNAVCIIRAHRGFTRRLAEVAETTVRTHIEGPYGLAQNLNHFDSVLLVAGGTGITFALSHFLSILKDAREDSTAVQRLHLVWNVRHHTDITWIAPLLNNAFELGLGGTSVTIDVHVTRSAAAASPNAVQLSALDEKDAHPDATDDNVNDGSPGSNTPTVTSSSSNSAKDKEGVIGTWSDTGVSPGIAAVLHMHRGRSHLDTILAADVATTRGAGAGLGMAVCGPTALVIDARHAVSNVNTVAKVWKGQTPVWFYSGNFGF